jgi:hypothetical protein
MAAKQKVTMMPIRRNTPVRDVDESVADFAFNLWLASGFRGGSPEKALLTALQMLMGTSPARLFLVPKHRVNVHRMGH